MCVGWVGARLLTAAATVVVVAWSAGQHGRAFWHFGLLLDERGACRGSLGEAPSKNRVLTQISASGQEGVTAPRAT